MTGNGSLVQKRPINHESYIKSVVVLVKSVSLMFFSALKIHVSEDCYRILKEIGGYTFLKRGEVYLKVICIHQVAHLTVRLDDKKPSV